MQSDTTGGDRATQKRRAKTCGTPPTTFTIINQSDTKRFFCCVLLRPRPNALNTNPGKEKFMAPL
jgi:hypothetical protein